MRRGHAHRDPRRLDRVRVLTWSLTAAALLAPLQVLVVIAVAGQLRPRYQPWQQSISELALGPYGWLVRSSVLVCGLGELGLVWVMLSLSAWRPASRPIRLLGLAAVCLVALCIFPAYRNQPPVPAFLHLAAFGVAAAALLACCLLLPRALGPAVLTWFVRISGAAAAVSAAALIGLAIHAAAIALQQPSPLFSFAGGIERFAVAGMALWLACLAVCVLAALRQERQPLRHQADGGEERHGSRQPPQRTLPGR